MNSLPKTVTRQRRSCDLNPGPSAPESSSLTTRLPSHAVNVSKTVIISQGEDEEEEEDKRRYTSQRQLEQEQEIERARKKRRPVFTEPLSLCGADEIFRLNILSPETVRMHFASASLNPDESRCY